jgi:hypothetical protein
VTKAVTLAEKVIPRSEIHSHIEAVTKTLEKTVENIQQLTALVECTNLHKDYTDAVEGVCYLALPGVLFILISSVATGLWITVLVLLASCAWRHFGRKGYQGIDEDDPFLPRNDNASPSYYSTMPYHFAGIRSRGQAFPVAAQTLVNMSPCTGGAPHLPLTVPMSSTDRTLT